MNYRANAILALHAETSLHAGAGSSVGAIDLPIQRESHSGWPCVFGSAVKGALRTRAEEVWFRGEETDPTTKQTKPKYDDKLFIVFGPDTTNAEAHAGALMVGDARLVLLPVRSLTTHFKWVTCPAILARLKRDAERLGVGGFETLEVTAPSGEENGLSLAGAAWVEAGKVDDNLFLEEYRFRGKPVEQKDAIISALSQLSDQDGFTEALRKQLTIVQNDLFAHLCEHATPVNAHVRLDSKTKIVARGALWYEETLAPETLLYVSLMAGPSRKSNSAPMNASKVMNLVSSELFNRHRYLQLGGNETVGMGWCRVKPLAGTSQQTETTDPQMQ